MSQQKELNLRIADLTPISVSVTDEEESSWREAASMVSRLWQSWSRRFPDKPSKEILAMIALRFAQAFVVHENSESETIKVLNELEKKLDLLLVDDLIKNRSQLNGNAEV